MTGPRVTALSTGCVRSACGLGFVVKGYCLLCVPRRITVRTRVTLRDATRHSDVTQASLRPTPRWAVGRRRVGACMGAWGGAGKAEVGAQRAMERAQFAQNRDFIPLAARQSARQSSPLSPGDASLDAPLPVRAEGQNLGLSCADGATDNAGLRRSDPHNL